MDAAELKVLQEAQASLMEANKKLLERAIRADAREEAARLLESISLPDQSKKRVISELLSREIPSTNGMLDAEKFAPLVEAAAKAEGEYVAALIGSGRVRSMGAAVPLPVDPQESARRAQAAKQEEEDAIAIFESLGMPKDAATFAARGRTS